MHLKGRPATWNLMRLFPLLHCKRCGEEGMVLQQILNDDILTSWELLPPV